MKRLSKKGHVLFFLLMACSVTACKVSKDIALPSVNLPLSYRNASLSDTATISTISWQVFFTDPDLHHLLEVALLHNSDLQVAVKNIEAAGIVLRQAKLAHVPSIGIQAGAMGSRPSENSLNGYTLSQFLGTKQIEDYTLGATLSWEADIWGKLRSQKAAAIADVLTTEAARKVIQTRVVHDIAKGYYNLLLLDAQLAIAVRNVSLNDSTLAMISLQYEAGQVTSLAVQQAEAQKLAAARLVPDFEQQMHIQENAISVLSGVMPKEIRRNSTLDAPQLSSVLSAGLPAAILSQRSDIRQLEYALTRANANVGYANANLYPSFSITAQAGLNAIKSSNWFNLPASLFGAAAGGITQPLFNRRKLRTAYELSRTDRDKTVIQFRQTVIKAVGEVSDALVKLEKLKEQHLLAGKRTAKLKEATHNSQLLFKNGLANYLEVITAQHNVLQSELELSGLKKAQLDAAVDLYRSVGGGWQKID